jgi:hypothetical protein
MAICQVRTGGALNLDVDLVGKKKGTFISKDSFLSIGYD